jgi:hypothetical protein
MHNRTFGRLALARSTPGFRTGIETAAQTARQALRRRIFGIARRRR